MTQLVDPDEIEKIVGVKRKSFRHVALAKSDERRVYLLHSYVCLAQYTDPRDCRFSKALDRGVDPADWVEDTPTEVTIIYPEGRLAPCM